MALTYPAETAAEPEESRVTSATTTSESDEPERYSRPHGRPPPAAVRTQTRRTDLRPPAYRRGDGMSQQLPCPRFDCHSLTPRSFQFKLLAFKQKLQHSIIELS